MDPAPASGEADRFYHRRARERPAPFGQPGRARGGAFGVNLPPMASTWIIGDVHGCAAELGDLLDRLGPGADDRVILVGDLFDKGPDPVRVLDTVREVGALAVLGNHDVAVRDHGGARLGGPAPAWKPAPYLVACLDRLEAAGRLEEAVALCARLPLFLRGAGFHVVHGGFDPELGPDETTEALATTLREYPPGVPDAPKWWTRWPGPEVAVFGHDARQGLLRHEVEGRPRCIGLDSGAVYGGHLSAWSPERDVLVQVPARRAWHPRGSGHGAVARPPDDGPTPLRAPRPDDRVPR